MSNFMQRAPLSASQKQRSPKRKTLSETEKTETKKKKQRTTGPLKTPHTVYVYGIEYDVPMPFCLVTTTITTITVSDLAAAVETRLGTQGVTREFHRVDAVTGFVAATASKDSDVLDGCHYRIGIERKTLVIDEAYVKVLNTFNSHARWTKSLTMTEDV